LGPDGWMVDVIAIVNKYYSNQKPVFNSNENMHVKKAAMQRLKNYQDLIASGIKNCGTYMCK
jgi:hypothetical protein